MLSRRYVIFFHRCSMDNRSLLLQVRWAVHLGKLREPRVQWEQQRPRVLYHLNHMDRLDPQVSLHKASLLPHHNKDNLFPNRVSFGPTFCNPLLKIKHRKLRATMHQVPKSRNGSQKNVYCCSKWYRPSGRTRVQRTFAPSHWRGPSGLHVRTSVF